MNIVTKLDSIGDLISRLDFIHLTGTIRYCQESNSIQSKTIALFMELFGPWAKIKWIAVKINRRPLLRPTHGKNEPG